MFFAPKGKYSACGMFSAEHIIALVVCIALIILALYFSRHITADELRKVCVVFAVFFTVTEIIKIFYHLYWGYYNIDSWFPLSFCGLFIYALWICGFGKGVVREAAQSYITCGAFFAGLAFLVIPATSLMSFPIFHYQCVYSLIFHSTMVYMSVMFMKNKVVKFNLRHLKLFMLYYGFFAVIALIMNFIFDSNLMLIMNPYNIPFKFFYDIRDFSLIAYITFVSVGYTVINFAGTSVINLLVGEAYKKVECEPETSTVLTE
ncbi:MAG: YwaF family protein [Clostridia bacterium]|nr:YwaF family protein [Clostridia bacterium]